MLPTRIIIGTILTVLAGGMLIYDQKFAPWFPFLGAFVGVAALLACRELIGLLGPERKPHSLICYLGVLWVLGSNWMAYRYGEGKRLYQDDFITPTFLIILGSYVIVVLVAFVQELTTFQEPGRSIERIALTTWIVAYLGLLPCFLVQLRWFFDPKWELTSGTQALAMAIFVPKCCDIGAYTVGRLIGRHKMAPVLSPKKTWEGAIGGLVFAVGAAVLLDRFTYYFPDTHLLKENLVYEIGFGVSVGLAGMIGDLGESLIKRDCQQKDASQVVPGFGGVLDVVDSVIFAAPVVYLWVYLLS